MNKDTITFKNWIREKGFNSIAELERASNVGQASLHKNIKYGIPITLDKAFKVANTLGVPIDDVLDYFCSEEMEKNRKAQKA